MHHFDSAGHTRKVKLAALFGVASALFLATPGAAQAQGYSADVEFLRPTFGYGAFHGVDVPMVRKPLTFRYGIVLQYQRDPLTLYNAVDATELGAVVANRFSAMLGASLDLSDRVTFHALVPTAYNFGTEIPEFASDGLGAGDAGIGGRAILIKTRRDRFNVGLRAGLILPTGRSNSYMSESNIRSNVGLLAAANIGPIRLGSDLGVMVREELVTSEDFVLNEELQWGNGVRLALPAATRTAFTAQVLSRAGLDAFLQGGAENSLEGLAGIEVLPSEAVTVDFSLGRGFTEGYGTTDLRVLGGLVIQHVPKPPPEEVIIVEAPPPPPPPPPPIIIEDEPEEPDFGEELAIVHHEQILIKEQPKFIVDTNILLEDSRPYLQAVADLLNGDARIGHMVIEGHASIEGSYDHNYTLSESRSRRLYEEFIKLGVHPDRMSYRGKGEVEPLEGFTSEEEEDLQKNRRVEFHIVKQIDEVEDMPDYDAEVFLPWNGEVVPIIQPKKPEPPKEEVDEPQVDEFGLPFTDDDEDFQLDIGPPPAAPEEGDDTGDDEDTNDQ